MHGGHSGDDINKKFANGIKLLTRFIYIINEKYGVKLVSFNSGRMHNAIPRDGVVIFAVPAQYKKMSVLIPNVFTAEVEAEFHVTEKEIKFSLESTDKGLVIKELDKYKIHTGSSGCRQWCYGHVSG